MHLKSWSMQGHTTQDDIRCFEIHLESMGTLGLLEVMQTQTVREALRAESIQEGGTGTLRNTGTQLATGHTESAGTKK